MDDTDDAPAKSVPIKSSLIGMQEATTKAGGSDQLDDRAVGVSVGDGIAPPYNPGYLAALQELNGTHSVCISKKAHREVGYGFDLEPHERVEPDEASEEEYERAAEFWFGRETKWKLGPKGTPAATPTEMFEKSRQDFYGIGWLTLEIMYAGADEEPAGMAYLPAKSVRIAKQSGTEQSDRIVGHGYVQKRNGDVIHFAEAGDRHGDDPTFVDKYSGEVYTGDVPSNPANEILFVPNPHPATLYYGMPTWISEIQTMVADQEARRFNRQRLENDLILDYVIIVEGGYLSEEARKQVRKHIQGTREADDTAAWILEAEDLADKGYDVDESVSIRIEPMNQVGDRDLSFSEFRQQNEHDIAKVHQVPRQLLDRHDATNSNTKEAIRSFTQEVIKPAQKRFAKRLYSVIHQTIFDIHDWKIEFVTKGGHDPEREAGIAQTKIEASGGALTMNEVRELLDHEPIDEAIGDQLMFELTGGGGEMDDMVEDMVSGHVDNATERIASEQRVDRLLNASAE